MPDACFCMASSDCADHRRPHPHGAKVANFLDFQQVGKRIGRRGSNQARALPVRQLARREVENPK